MDDLEEGELPEETDTKVANKACSMFLFYNW